MAQINFANKQINCKIVYYGPGFCGKTTNLLNIHDKLPEDRRREMTSIATEGDRTLFFDFLPLDVGRINGMEIKIHLYTVPGQVCYNSTRKLVLQGVDGIVFVADSQRSQRDENIESLENLKENLKELDLDINEIPLVMQYNKRDLTDIMEISQMQDEINRFDVAYFEAIACSGEGVYQTLKAISQFVMEHQSQKVALSARNTMHPQSDGQTTGEKPGTKEQFQAKQPLEEKKKIQVKPHPRKRKSGGATPEKAIINSYSSVSFNKTGKYTNFALTKNKKKLDKKPGIMRKITKLFE